MPVDGSGNITRPGSPIPVDGQTAISAQVNSPVDDIYAALNLLMFLDGRKPLGGNIPMNGYRATGASDAVGQQDYVTLAQVTSLLSTFGSVPTGSLFPLTGTVVPAGYVWANGQSLARATFPTLWAWVQSSGNLAASEGSKTRGQYGPGNGSTTFTVPNLDADNGYFIRPMGSGRTVGSVQSEEFQSHYHSALISDPGHPHSSFGSIIRIGGTGTFFAAFNSGSGKQLYYGSAEVASATTGVRVTSSNGFDTTYSAGGSETRPKNVSYPWIIKA